MAQPPFAVIAAGVDVSCPDDATDRVLVISGVVRDAGHRRRFGRTPVA